MGITATSETARAGARAANRARRQKAAERRRADEEARQGISAALRARVREEKDAIIEALMAPVLDPALTPLQRQGAALKVLERALGRPRDEQDDDPTATAALSLEDLVALLEGPVGNGGSGL
jgi:hypothetical protein